jgi:osmoprotectant transport system ATP-binding protein
MGDRIAILREGGQLVQYDSPENILANPVNDFVARFVGADRGLKRLALTRLDQIRLEDASAARGAGEASTVPSTATLRDALSVMMSDSMRPLLVVDADGNATGAVTIELINEALRRGRKDEQTVTRS